MPNRHRWGPLVALKPAGLSFVEAAAVPLAGGTAGEAVARRLRRRPGQTFLILGGVGRMRSFAVQYARTAGARVLATASAANRQTLRSVGASMAIDDQHDDGSAVIGHETNSGADAISDTVSGDTLAQLRADLWPFDPAATVPGATGDRRPRCRRGQTLHRIFLSRERQRMLGIMPLRVDRRVRSRSTPNGHGMRSAAPMPD